MSGQATMERLVGLLCVVFLVDLVCGYVEVSHSLLTYLVFTGAVFVAI